MRIRCQVSYLSNVWRERWGGQFKLVFGRLEFALGILVLEAAAIISVALVTGLAYHVVAYGGPGEVVSYAAVGVTAALLFTLPILFGDNSKIEDFQSGRRSAEHTFMHWNYVFLCLAVIGFLTKTTGLFSRAWLVAFYGTGLVAVAALDVAVARFVVWAIETGRIASRRIMLIGPDEEIANMTAELEHAGSGCRVVAVAGLPTDAASAPAAFAAAADKARAMGVEDVIVLTDWARTEAVHTVVDAFAELPVAVHLGAASFLGRFTNARVARFGTATALSLTAPPLTLVERAAKRLFDIAVASLALLLLAPLFVVVAILIKRDSKGPIFFRQRRRGYNLKEFRIWKFRTMSTLDDGDVIKQASANDVRVTRIGALLRRSNIDELPQLINVLAGDMSIVGPRPHAIAHDRLFETRITKYRRRLNVRPGITGWAQIHGLRGPTETDNAMRKRVEYDLYYIDNWSITLDLYVILATAFSRKAYKNAF